MGIQEVFLSSNVREKKNIDSCLKISGITEKENNKEKERKHWIPNQVGDDDCMVFGDDIGVVFGDDSYYGSSIKDFEDDSGCDFEDDSGCAFEDDSGCAFEDDSYYGFLQSLGII